MVTFWKYIPSCYTVRPEKIGWLCQLFWNPQDVSHSVWKPPTLFNPHRTPDWHSRIWGQGDMWPNAAQGMAISWHLSISYLRRHGCWHICRQNPFCNNMPNIGPRVERMCVFMDIFSVLKVGYDIVLTKVICKIF